MFVSVGVCARSSCEIGFFFFLSFVVYISFRSSYLYIYSVAYLLRRLVACSYSVVRTHFILSPIIRPRRRLGVRRINLRTERDLWLFINRGLLVPLRHSFPLFRCTCIHTHTHTHTNGAGAFIYTRAHLYYIHICKYIYLCMGVRILCVYVYDIMLLNGENHTWTARATSGGFSLLHIIWYYYIIIIIFRARPPSSLPLFNPVPGNDRKIFINSGDSGYCGVVHESTTFRWLFLNHNIIAIRTVKTNGSWRRVQRCAWTYTVSTEKSEK